MNAKRTRCATRARRLAPHAEPRLPASFQKWTSARGYQITAADAGVVLSDPGGELRYHVVSKPDGVALLRAERGEDPVSVMTAADIEDVVRHLATVLGYDDRAIKGLPRIRLPFDWSTPAPGFRPLELGSGWTGLWTDDGRILDVAMIDQDVVHPVIMFSYVASAPVADLIASYESPDGAPLLARFVR